MQEVLYDRGNVFITKRKLKQTQVKEKQCISSRGRKKLVHDLFISTKFSWKEGDRRRI